MIRYSRIYLCKEYYPKSLLKWGPFLHNDLVFEQRASLKHKIWLYVLYDNKNKQFYITVYISNKIFYTLDKSFKNSLDVTNKFLELFEMYDCLIFQRNKSDVFSYEYIRYDHWDSIILNKYTLREEEKKHNMYNIIKLFNDELILENNKQYKKFVNVPIDQLDNMLKLLDYSKLIEKNKIKQKKLYQLIKDELDIKIVYVQY